MLRIAHVITDLARGGAEMMLYRLLTATDRASFDPLVFSLTDVGALGEKIQRLGVPVRTLGMRRGVPSPVGLLRLARWLKEARVDLVQSWLYHADLVGGLAARLAGVPVVWGVHHTTFDPRSTKRTTLWTVRTCLAMSGWLPARIVCCSESTLKVHLSLGYDARRSLVIPNGFDLGEFQGDPASRDSVRAELGLPAETPLIGLIARFHPAKDHANFVGAAQILHHRFPETHFLLAGGGVDGDNATLAGWINAAGLTAHFHLLGARDDIPRLTTALDIASTSSREEAFPLVIGEAMCCGVPCVVTDVGDSAAVVGSTGRVVPPSNPQALAQGWQDLLEAGPEGRAALGRAARQRIEERFALKAVVGQYERLYQEIVPGKTPNLRRAVASVQAAVRENGGSAAG